MRKAIKKDHRLALQLWDTGNNDARVLATMIADPKQFDEKLALRWAADVKNYGMADAFTGLFHNAPGAQALMERWVNAGDEWYERMGWGLLGEFALHHSDEFPDAYFEPYLAIIGRDIHQRANRVRQAMNSALIAIGMRGGELERQAIELAGTIGEVIVDHGDTYCKTPDAAEYILKAKARKKAQPA
jgi:3-methyladenine DNA glycosylase AlkD